MKRLLFPSKKTFVQSLLLMACLFSFWLYHHYFLLLHIKSGSMEPGLPTFCKILVFCADPKYSRWEAIAFRHPLRLQEIQVKRIVGLPGERIRVLDGNLYRSHSGEWNLLKKPVWLQEKGQFWRGNPLFEEIRHHRQEQNIWIAENRWKGWDISQWQRLDSEPLSQYRGQGTLTYTLPLWAIFDRPGGIRSDQSEKIKVLERPHAEVRFRLKLETQPSFSGLIQEAQHEIRFQANATELKLSVHYLWNPPFPEPAVKKISLSPQSFISLEFGNYDDFAFVSINGTRLELDYRSDPFQEKSEAKFQFHFEHPCLLQEAVVEIDNAYKEEIEGTIETTLKRENPAEYFVCGDNTLTARVYSGTSGNNT